MSNSVIHNFSKLYSLFINNYSPIAYKCQLLLLFSNDSKIIQRLLPNSTIKTKPAFTKAGFPY